MNEIEKTVSKETKFLSIAMLIFSILAQLVFFMLGEYNYTVLLGFVYGGVLSVINFWLLGITLENVSVMVDQDMVKKRFQSLYRVRSFGLILLLVLGIIIPVFNMWAVILSVIFPKIYYLIIPFFRQDLVR